MIPKLAIQKYKFKCLLTKSLSETSSLEYKIITLIQYPFLIR